ncbi:MAG: hypothetical protein KF718_27890 [Polyangiaceae bacterium]|nr:hypothetical protein [Polyangiaceae bacterium]
MTRRVAPLIALLALSCSIQPVDEAELAEEQLDLATEVDSPPGSAPSMNARPPLENASSEGADPTGPTPYPWLAEPTDPARPAPTPWLTDPTRNSGGGSTSEKEPGSGSSSQDKKSASGG